MICESDSQSAIQFIKDGVDRFHPHFPLIDHIRDLLAYPWTVILRHTLREGNMCADWLAKQGATSSSNLTVWSACPSGLATLMLADTTGLTRLRL